MRTRAREWFEQVLLRRFAPASMAALLATLVLIFAFQPANITTKTLYVALIAVPILIQDRGRHGRARPTPGAAARQREEVRDRFNTVAPGTDLRGVLVRAH
jgi:hypothetical protein